MLSSKGSRKVEQFRSTCHEEMKEEEIVKMNKSKGEPVNKWHCPRQAVSFKVHRRAVWSLIFLLFEMHLAKAEVQEDQACKGIAREAHQDLQDGTPWMKEGMTIWEGWCFKRKRNKQSPGKGPRTYEGNSQGRDPKTLEESSKGGNVSTRQIHNQRKGSLWWAKRKEQLASLFVSERKEEDVREKRQEEEQETQGETISGKSGRWLFHLLILMQYWFCVGAAAGRLGRNVVVNLGGESLQKGAKGRAPEIVEVDKRS